MNYELAKELKEAGYPQIGQFGYSRERDGSPAYNGPPYLIKDETWIVAPTLEELIEACGDKFGALLRVPGGKWQAMGGDIEKSDKEGQGRYSIQVLDSTPCISAAYLWLALNKK